MNDLNEKALQDLHEELVAWKSEFLKETVHTRRPNFRT